MVADLVRDRHLRKRGFWQAVQQPGMPSLVSAGHPIHSTVTACTPLQPAPTPGQHNLEIYAGELMGMSEAEIATYTEQGIFY